VRQLELGKGSTETIAAWQFWRTCINLSLSDRPHTLLTMWNVSAVSSHHRAVSLAVYARRRRPPTHVRFDVFHLLHTASSVRDTVMSRRHASRQQEQV